MKKAVLMAALTAAVSPALSRGEASTPPPASPPPSASTPPPASTPSSTPEVKVKSIHWIPPVSAGGSLGYRVGGGARGVGGTDASVVALVPDQVALTTNAQPSLFWFQSKPAKASLELTLIQPGNPKPLLILGSPSAKPGIHRIRLVNHGIKLAPDVGYKWTVSLVSDPADRSMDVVATGMVKRIEPSKELAQELAGASPADRAAIYAQAGIWYDALDAISNEIDKNPGDSSLRQARADLLSQVGLPPMDKQ